MLINLSVITTGHAGLAIPLTTCIKAHPPDLRYGTGQPFPKGRAIKGENTTGRLPSWFLSLLTLCQEHRTFFKVLPFGEDFPPEADPPLEEGGAVNSAYTDTLTADTAITKPISDNSALKSKLLYSSDDSIRFDMARQKAFLFGNAEVNYESTSLKSAFIELDMVENLVFAKGIHDSSGNLLGKPVFSDEGQEFTAETISYNFKTKKGLITQVITKEGEGFIHSDTTKKYENNVLYIKNGAYTTCDLPHPHFAIKSSRIKIIPDDKIITGPAYLSIADIPTPLAVPFGLFPNKKGRSSGILIPSYGESVIAGFYLKEGGYYFGFNDYLDLSLRGDIYSRGSWSARALSSYKKRYSYNGSFTLKYSEFKFGEEELPNFSKQKDFFVDWTHYQDPKARPNSKFTAQVNAGSNSYNKYNSNISGDYLKNTFQSNISYSKSWAGKPYNFSANLRHSQNTITKKVDLNLPDVLFSVNRINPFTSKKGASQAKWYNNIGMNYRMDVSNRINTYDSLLFTSTKFKDFNSGIKHSVPISTSFNLLKYFNFTPSFTITDRWYFQSIVKSWVEDTLISGTNTVVGYVKTDTVPGFKSGSDFIFNAALKTKLFGMIQFNKSPVKAIRHVLTPSIGFSYRPDFSEDRWGYYKKVQIDSTGNLDSYSIFSGGAGNWNGIYGSPASGKYGLVNFTLSNNLEMKVKTKKDTANPEKKIVLIENLTLSSSYNMAADSLKWSFINLAGYTNLFKNTLYIKYGARFDPYLLIQDSTGVTKNIDRFEWKENKRIARIENSDWLLSLNLRLGPDVFSGSTNNTINKSPKQSAKGSDEELEMINANPGKYVDFSLPWSLNVGYSLNYINDFHYTSSSALDSVSDNLIQSLNFSGEVNITDNWKIGFRSGYDMVAKEFTYTTIDIYRDLHCWEMNFNWIPFGLRQSYNFNIKVKSSILQDLKLTRKREWYDNTVQ